MTTLVVVNTGAGRGRAGRALPALRERIPALAACEVLEAPDAATARVRLGERLADPAVRKLVSIGGDGSAQLAVHALVDSGRRDIVFALVPAGTGSDFARHLGLVREPGEALRRALAAVSSRPIDLIEVTATTPSLASPARRVCLNIASAGLSGEVDEAVEAARRTGGGSYLGATLSALRRYRPPAVRVRLDGRVVHDGPLLLAAVANGRYFGQGMPVAPRADEADGLVDLVVLRPVAAWKLPLRLPVFLRGRHLDLPEVGAYRGLSVDIEATEPEDAGLGRSTLLAFDLDGEPLRATAASLRVLPGAVRLATT